MAYTKIWQIHTTPQKAINYIIDPNKTRDDMVTSYNCEAETAATEFEMTDILASTVHPHREDTKDNRNVLAHHFLQSFAATDDITPERAHELGLELAARLLKGKYEFVIATHIDKDCVHNHIIFNATSFYDLEKFKSAPFRTAKEIRTISDQICIENGLSVIDPQSPGMSYWEWKQRKRGTSWKAKIEKVIDTTIGQAQSYAQFKSLLEDAGVTIREGKDIRFKLDGMKNFSVGRGQYSKHNIIERIRNNQRSFVEEISEFASVSAQYSLRQLSQTLSLLDREHISNIDDFVHCFEQIDAKISATKGKQKEVDLKNKQYKDVARCLSTLRECESKLAEGDALKGKAKASFDQQHELDHQAFQMAYRQLHAFRVNPDIDLDKVITLIEDQSTRSQKLADEVKDLEKKRVQLEKAQEMVLALQKSKDHEQTDVKSQEQVERETLD